MKKIVNEVYLYTYEDEDRYRHLLQNMIDKGELQLFKIFHQLDSEKVKNKRQRTAQKEAAEAEEAAKLLGMKIDGRKSAKDQLSELILGRKEERMSSLIKSLEMKYGKKQPEPDGQKATTIPKKKSKRQSN